MGQALSSLNLEHAILILDAILRVPLDYSKMETITQNLVDALLETLDMKILGKLEIYPATDQDYPGWSFIQPITTSHISGHYFIDGDGKNPNIHMDIYSCKHFSWKDSIITIDKVISLEKWSADFIGRNISADKRSALAIQGEGAMFKV
jgi:hypothetical protein